jgi:hypothetical protein
MWRWLFDAHRLLGVAVEVLDEEFAVLVPSRDGRVVRERFEASRSEPIQPLLAASLTRDGAFVASAGGVRLACAPIVCAGALAGAMLVGTEERSLEETDLARLASLLADAIGDQLARPAQEHHGHLHQISALYQLLHAAITTGSEAEVIRTFAEALSIWEEIEVLAYRADLDGRYALTLALPGSDPSVMPRLLEYEPLAAGPNLRRLSPTEREHLGFGGEGETVLAFLGSDGGRWLIALNSGGVSSAGADPGWTRDAPDRERSEMYVAALGHALNGCVAVETSRLTWAIMHQFIDRDPPVEAAGRALQELSGALAATGSFVVRGPGGYPVLVAGENRSGLQGLPVTDARILRSQVIITTPFSASLEMRARSGKSFTPRDLKLFQAAVATFAAWLPSALRRVSGAERRGVVRSFDQIVDRYARESHEARDEASLILISAGEEMLSLDTTHTWIKQLRPQLRPTDLAGRLSSGELGILLLQTPHAGAQTVARRLSRVLAAGAGEEPVVRIGVASQLDELVSAEALIARARMQPVDPSVSAGPPRA